MLHIPGPLFDGQTYAPHWIAVIDARAALIRVSAAPNVDIALVLEAQVRHADALLELFAWAMQYPALVTVPTAAGGDCFVWRSFALANLQSMLAQGSVDFSIPTRSLARECRRACIAVVETALLTPHNWERHARQFWQRAAQLRLRLISQMCREDDQLAPAEYSQCVEASQRCRILSRVHVERADRAHPADVVQRATNYAMAESLLRLARLAALSWLEARAEWHCRYEEARYRHTTLQLLRLWYAEMGKCDPRVQRALIDSEQASRRILNKFHGSPGTAVSVAECSASLAITVKCGTPCAIVTDLSMHCDRVTFHLTCAPND